MPVAYVAPVNDYVFLLHEVLKVQERSDLPGYAGTDEEGTRAILEEAGRFFSDVWAPLYEIGDKGCNLADGIVSTPDGFAEAYAKYCNRGWHGVGIEEGENGGLARPLAMAIREFGSSANTSLGLYSALTVAAANTLTKIGDQWVKNHVVPPMAQGRWTGTMCLTEPHCGTDLRLMRTRADAEPDGSFLISGTKIFISGGDHDLAENIVHLVLAKIPDAQGKLSDDLGSVNLFMVPKYRVEPHNGETSGRNGIAVGNVERKMGLKGNATCTLHFENAVGYRLGRTKAAAGKNGRTSSSAGMSGMFEMMNGARLETGAQAMASAALAYSKAAQYARERSAGRAMDPAHRSGAKADPIIVHPDVRRLLLKQASFIEASRAFCLWVGMLLDEPKGNGNEVEKVAAQEMANLLTPVIKAYLSDKAFESANDAIQIHGGHGYICDTGVEQIARDARVFQLYEGANGVQALDLVSRKLTANGGIGFRTFKKQLEEASDECRTDPRVRDFARLLKLGVEELDQAARWLCEQGTGNQHDRAAASYDFLTMMGIISCGFMWLLIAASASRQIESGRNDAFFQRKLVLAQYWFAREFPKLVTLRTRLEIGSSGLMDLAAAHF